MSMWSLSASSGRAVSRTVSGTVRGARPSESRLNYRGKSDASIPGMTFSAFA